jgi:putative copper resistance protein D
VTIFFAITRALHFVSVMMLFGASAFGWLLRAKLKTESRLPRALFALCTAVALVTIVLSLGFVASEMTDNPGAIFDGSVVGQVVRETLYGQLALVRFALLALVLPVVWLRPKWLPEGGTMLAGSALVLLGPTSHASAAVVEPYKYVFAANDGVHLLAGGFWIGGLVALLPAILAKPIDLVHLTAALRLFSRWAMGAVALLVVVGSANAIAILDFRGMAWSLSYLSLLALKLVLAAVMIALALTNRFGLMPGLARGESEAAQTLPFTVIAELGCALAILLVVGILGLTSPMAM